jgi:hypothetical protein
MCKVQEGKTYPSGNGLVGMSTISLPNIAVSVWKPFARFISATCGVEIELGVEIFSRRYFVTRYEEICLLAASVSELTVTLYFTARPASVSLFLTCK